MIYLRCKNNKYRSNLTIGKIYTTPYENKTSYYEIVDDRGKEVMVLKIRFEKIPPTISEEDSQIINSI